MAWLGFRSLLWVTLLPGTVTGFVPVRYFGLGQARLDLSRPAHLAGIVIAALGAAGLAACVWEFARSGRGTLAPVDPPTRLVVRGLYRYTRNPMYVSVSAIVLGELLIVGSRAFATYVLCWLVGVNLFVLGYEEPTLRRMFGADYERYAREVPRWLPRRRRMPQSRE